MRAAFGARHIKLSSRSHVPRTQALMETTAFLQPKPQTALCLGLGAGTAPAFLREAGIQTDVVERDAAVASMVRCGA